MEDKTEKTPETASFGAKRQLGLWIASGACILLAVGIAVGGLRSNPSPMPKAPDSPTISVLHGNGAEKFWVASMEQQLKKQNEALSSLQQELEGLQQASQTIENHSSPVAAVSTPSATTLSTDLAQTPSFMPSGIDVSTVELKSVSPKPLKNPDSFVPAGTFVQAVMLGAADASAGVTSQANPSPMLFRLTAEGELPHHAHSHLKDCVVTAAVVGDISSERGHVRLERLSCIFPNGEIVEQPVEGTVFAMDAKNGVRGRPVWREGPLLARATFAGAVSGLAGSITSLTSAVSASDKTHPAVNIEGNLLKATGAQGASAALEKLAQYHIQRAEQYHPVIQLSAGQTVDVVFLKGFYLDGGKHEETSAHEHTEPELFSDNEVMPEHQETGLTLSPAQIEKIKQHEAALGWEVGKT